MESAVQQTARSAETSASRPDRGTFDFGKLIAWIVLVGMTILFIIPFLWMLSTSLKGPTEWFGADWIPSTFAWSNYVTAFSFGRWPEWFRNTFIIAGFSVIGQVISCSLVSYSFGRLRWPGRDQVFVLVLATMMLPGVVTLIPSYILFSKYPAFGFMGSDNWINTFLPFIVPAFTGSAFYIFLLRQFMRGIPMELSEAARIDGASELRIWWSVILPLTKPALAYVAITTFQGAWEDFMGPLLYLRNEALYTVQIGLTIYQNEAGGSPNWGHLMAGSLVVMLPVVLIFVFFQRYFIEGVSLTGIAGR
jgi:multiple sugar transport system permease protein